MEEVGEVAAAVHEVGQGRALEVPQERRADPGAQREIGTIPLIISI